MQVAVGRGDDQVDVGVPFLLAAVGFPLFRVAFGALDGLLGAVNEQLVRLDEDLIEMLRGIELTHRHHFFFRACGPADR